MAVFKFWVLIEVTNEDLQDGVFSIPDGVTGIADCAFAGCTSLSSVIIPKSVTSIGAGAFWGCASLSSVIIPEGVTSIGNKAFLECESLGSVIIPESVTSIGYSAFWECESLTRVIIDTERSDEYIRIKEVLWPYLHLHVRSKKAYLLMQDIWQRCRADDLVDFYFAKFLDKHIADIFSFVAAFEGFSEDGESLGLQQALLAEEPPLLSDNESAWQKYEAKLSTIASEWKKKRREQWDCFTACDFIKKYIAPTAIKADLLARLSQDLQKGEIVRLDTGDRELLQTLPVLLKKVPQWILERWGVTRDPAPIALTSVSAVLYSERAEEGANALTAAEVAPSATNAG